MAKTRKFKNNREKLIRVIQDQYDDLFSGQDEPPTPLSMKEVEALQARIAELEGKLEELPDQEQHVEVPATSREKAQKDSAIPMPPPAEASTEAFPIPESTPARVKKDRRVFKGFTNFSLRTKLIAVFVLAVVASVSIVAFLTNRTLSASLTQQIGNSLVEFADAKAIEVGLAINREVDILKTLAQNDTLYYEAQSANIFNTFNQVDIERLDNQWRDADAANNDADALVASVLYTDLSSALRNFQSEFPQHVEVFLTDRQGLNVGATNRTSDYYQADEEWWQTAFQEGLYIGQPEYDQSAGIIAINIATTIKAEGSDYIVGVLRTTVNFETLNDSLEAGLFGQTGRTDIYLPNGQELTLQTGEDGVRKVVMKEADLDINVLSHSQYPYLEVLHSGVPTLASQASVVASSGTEVDEQAVNNLNWKVVSLQDQAEALQPVTTQTRNILFVALATAAVAGLLAFALAQGLSGPIIRLTETAEKVAAGDLSVQAEVETGDETGILASAFNNMVSQLRDMVSSLEQRVAERTHDLELASDVGRAVTERTADVTRLLSDAVELIRDRFKLYHTQIYLVDPGQQELVLRAGTGEVGVELLRRGHHLPINSASLNGRAATEGHAVIVEDTHESVDFLPNPLLPNTRSEMAVPLVVGKKVVGVLDMQSEEPGSLNETNLPAFETLAGQLAIAIQNASLFSEAEQARSEVEAQVRRLTEQGWQDFMNAIERGQRIGFSFDQAKTIPLDTGNLTNIPTQDTVEIPITVTGAKIGAFQLDQDPDRRWSENEAELIQATAAQLGQHIENLRLLAQTERYRAQAEQAAKRLTREGWSTVQARGEMAPGFEFNLNEVIPLASENGGPSGAYKQPLIVRDEPIGELAIDKKSVSRDQIEIITAVADQLSIHIETLRLADELQKRAAELQELDRLKTAFLANMSHELRTPLNSILGFADVLLEELDGPLTDTMSNDLQLIQKNGNHLLHLINDVLDMAKIEAGKMNLSPEQFRVQEILEDVVNISSPQATGKQITLAIDQDSDAQIEIFADRTRISQVLLNMVTNAVKFTDQGSVTLCAKRDGENALITVRDTGEGIPSDKLESIFQEFTQVDTSTTRKAGGTGLGLPISRRLIEMHGGRMWAESPGAGEGMGSTFFVVLPIKARIVEVIEAHERQV